MMMMRMMIAQLDASYRACCEDRDVARQELDKLRISLQTLEDIKLQSEQQISSLSAEVSFIFVAVVVAVLEY